MAEYVQVFEWTTRGRRRRLVVSIISSIEEMTQGRGEAQPAPEQPTQQARRTGAGRTAGPADRRTAGRTYPGSPRGTGPHPGGKSPLSTPPGVCGAAKRGWRCRLGSPGRRGPPKAQIASTEAYCEGQSSLTRTGTACVAFPPEPFGNDDACPRSPSRIGDQRPTGFAQHARRRRLSPWRNPRPVSPARLRTAGESLAASRSRTFTCTPNTRCWTAPPASRNCSRRSRARA